MSPMPSPNTASSLGLVRRGGVKERPRSWTGGNGGERSRNRESAAMKGMDRDVGGRYNERRLDISLNEHHQTPLHLAAIAGHTEVAHLLCVVCPSYIQRRDYRGRDAVMGASEFGHDTIVQIILTAVQAGEVPRWGGGKERMTLEEVLGHADVVSYSLSLLRWLGVWQRCLWLERQD